MGRRRETTEELIARWDRERREREARAIEAARQYERDYPVRADLHPVAERLGRAQVVLSHTRERQVVHGEDPPPLIVAAAEAAEAAALAELAAAAEAAETPGIRVPMMLPDCGWYLSIGGAGVG